jgi:shikimate kinase
MNIFLTGFMGTGKTVVGKEVAGRLKRKFIDMDRLIELRAGRPIADIFRWEGEPAFRALEREAARQVARERHSVIATGGGVLLDSSNFQVLSSSGHLVCLTASPEILAHRLHADTSRPLLAGVDRKERIVHMLKVRETVYRLCPIQISTNGKSIHKVADEVIAAIKRIESEK